MKSEEGFLYRLADDGETYVIYGYEGDADVVGIPYYIDGVAVTELNPDEFPTDKKFYVYSIDEDFEYKKTDDGTGIIITKFVGDIDNFMIQEEIEGLPVVEIGDDAFEASDVVDVAIPSTVKKIDKDGFYDCKKLETVYFSEGLEEIGQDAFGQTALTEIDLPDSLTTLGGGCFANTKLKKVYIPKNTVSIYSTSFTYSEVEEFEVDRANDVFASKDGVIYLKDMKTIAIFPPKKAGSFVIPAEVTKIGGGSFIYCDQVTEVSLEDGSQLSEIGPAFIGCPGLTKIDLSKSGSSIEAAAIYNCSNLKEIYFPQNLMTIPADLFSDAGIPSTLTLVKYNANCDCQIEWPESVEVQTYDE